MRAYALWTSLALELLARAALANVHPALLAEPDKAGSNLISALGFEPIEKKFAPKSIAVSEVFRRLSASDTAILSAALALHPEAADKIGTGIRDFSVRSADFGSKCFWVNRTDGTTEKFSHKACV